MSYNTGVGQRTAVVTGASSLKGIGFHTALRYAQEGWAVAMMDLTTLEGKDTPGKVAYICRKALQPIDAKYQVPPCAAVCVYPSMVRHARKFLGEELDHAAFRGRERPALDYLLEKPELHLP